MSANTWLLSVATQVSCPPSADHCGGFGPPGWLAPLFSRCQQKPHGEAARITESDQNAICRPSGDQLGKRSATRESAVRFRGCPPTCATQMSQSPPVVSLPVGFAANASVRLSGDQAGESSTPTAAVTCTGFANTRRRSEELRNRDNDQARMPPLQRPAPAAPHAAVGVYGPRAGSTSLRLPAHASGAHSRWRRRISDNRSAAV